MITALGEQIIWMRVQRYLSRHTPRLITTRGPGAIMAAQAARLVCEPEQKVRVVFPPTQGNEKNFRISIAKGILGLTPEDRVSTWSQVLNFSLAREIAIQDPQVIIIALPEPAAEEELKRQLPFQDVIDTHTETVQSRIQIKHIRPLKPKGYAAELTYGRRTYEALLSHVLSVRHVMAVVAVLANLSQDEQAFEKNLKKLRKLGPTLGDLSLEEGVNGSQLLNYSLCSAWEGVLEGMEVLTRMEVSGRKVTVLAAGNTMNNPERSTYEEIGEATAGAADLALFVGSAMRRVQTAAKKTAPELDTHYFETTKEAHQWLTPYIKSGDVVFTLGTDL